MYDLFKSITSSIAIIAAYLVITYICFYFGTVINVITPVVMFIVTMLIAYTHKFVLENRSKEKVKSAMGKYMSEDVMKRVIMNIDNLGLGGKKQQLQFFLQISEDLHLCLKQCQPSRFQKY